MEYSAPKLLPDIVLIRFRLAFGSHPHLLSTLDFLQYLSLYALNSLPFRHFASSYAIVSMQSISLGSITYILIYLLIIRIIEIVTIHPIYHGLRKRTKPRVEVNKIKAYSSKETK